MSKEIDSLTDDEVRQITVLVETLEQSRFDFLQLDVGKLKVTIGKGSASQAMSAVAARGTPAASSAAAAQPAASPAAATAPVPAAAAPGTSQPAPRKDGHAEDGTVPIVTPMMGRFYAKPEPGAEPFIGVGSEVNPDTVVGLVEVMKVFTAARAGVAGVVTEICVQDAELVEYGHVLFRVRPAATAVDAARAGAKGSRKGSRS